MNKDEAQKLLMLVNSKEHMNALHYYMDLRIERYKVLLTTCENMDQVRRYQGAIEELQRIKTLRDEVLNPRDLNG